MQFKKLAVLVSALTLTGLAAGDAVAQRRDGKWVELGCQQVSFIGKDRDTIKVGRREGRFKAIKLAARGNDVEMLDLKVIYANGEPDDIPVRSLIRAGRETGALDPGCRGQLALEPGDPRVGGRAGVDVSGEDDGRRGCATEHRREGTLDGEHRHARVERLGEDDERATVVPGDDGEDDGPVEVDDGPADLGAVLELELAHRLR